MLGWCSCSSARPKADSRPPYSSALLDTVEREEKEEERRRRGRRNEEADDHTYPRSSLKRSDTLESKRVRFSDVEEDDGGGGGGGDSDDESDDSDRPGPAPAFDPLPRPDLEEEAAAAAAAMIAQQEQQRREREEQDKQQRLLQQAAAPPMSAVAEEDEQQQQQQQEQQQQQQPERKEEEPRELKPNIHHKKFEFSPGSVDDKYEVTDTVLGSGAFGTVNLAYLRAGSYRPEDEFAVKSVNKSHRLLKSGEFMHEIDILSKIEHPSVIRLRDTYDTPEACVLVMEFAGGGELFDRIIDERKFEERRVRDICTQLTDAIAYLHAQGITHRDIKPENILFVSHDSDTVKLSDFGFAQSLNNAESKMQVKKKRGTMGYASPEIFSGRPYDEKCDVWSLGIVVYVMLAGIPPFAPMDEYSVSEALDVAFWKHAGRAPKVPPSPVEFPEAYFLGVSEEAKDWLRCALELDPIQRARSVDLLRHPWLKATDRLHSTTAFSQQMVGRLKNMYSSLR